MLLQYAGDVLVRQPMKAIPSNTASSQFLWQREFLIDQRRIRMKGCIETGDLWNRNKCGSESTNASDIVWLVQRREWIELLELLEYLIGHYYAMTKRGTTMHNTMRDRDRCLQAELF
jgi:hypothetical protein